MKNLLLLIGLFMLLSEQVSAQGTERNIGIDFEISAFATGSGFSPGTELYIKVNEYHRKSLALGIYYCSDYRRILGITVNHEIFLLRKEQNKLEPFLFYNFIYRRSRISEELSEMSEGMLEGSYKSLEHHFGLGMQINVSKAVYLSSELGIGAYFGSIEKPVFNPVLMNFRGGNGFSMIAKIGAGVNIF